MSKKTTKAKAPTSKKAPSKKRKSGGTHLLQGVRLPDGSIDGSRGFWVGGECGADE